MRLLAVHIHRLKVLKEGSDLDRQRVSHGSPVTGIHDRPRELGVTVLQDGAFGPHRVVGLGELSLCEDPPLEQRQVLLKVGPGRSVSSPPDATRSPGA